MKRPPLPYLLLLPLLAVLLFGNCGGGGVRGVVDSMLGERKDRFRAIIAQQSARRAAGRQLPGAARRAEYRRLDSLKTARIDSLFRPVYYERERKKYAHRRRKMTRQLLSPDNRPLIPPIRIPIDTR